MKILMIILSATLLSVSTHCQAQNWDEWFNQKETQKKYLLEQVVALQVYLDYVKKGYEIARKGLTLIGDIKDGKFNLHKDYFESLENVNHAIGNSEKVAYILAMQSLVQKDIQSLKHDCQSDENFTAGETRYILKVCDNLLIASNDFLSDLGTVITAGEVKMKDNERLARVDAISYEVRSLFAFTRSFGNGARLLALQRAKEQVEIEATGSLYDVQP